MTQAGAVEEPPQRTIEQPCRACDHGFVTVINGLFIRKLRYSAHVTLSQAAQACGVSRSHLSRMERGQEPFQPGYAEILERFFARRMRSGDE